MSLLAPIDHPTNDHPTNIDAVIARAGCSLRRPTIYRFDLDGTQLPPQAEGRHVIPRLDPRWRNGDWNPADDRHATTTWTCFVVGGSACYHRR